MSIGNTYADLFGLTEEDKELIARLTDPVPYNEEQRIMVLRQTQLLDSDRQEPTFDRFTAMARRLFGTNISAISLVDVNRCYFKSNAGMPPGEGSIQWPRQNTFCTYTILPHSPEVFVVEDASAIPEYANFPIVAGPPYIRFYAAAALVVEGVRLGTLCIASFTPRKFSLAERQNLLDLGNAAAEVIAERRRSFLASSLDRSTMMLTMMHGLRTPLFAVDIGASVLSTEKQTIVEALRRVDPSQSTASLLSNTMDDIVSSVQKLKMAVESTVVLGKALAVVTAAHNNRQGRSDTELMRSNSSLALKNSTALDIESVASQIKVISGLIGKRTVEWDYQMFRDSVLANMCDGNNTVKSFPDALNFVLLSVLTHIVSYDNTSDPIRVSVATVKCSSVHSYGKRAFSEDDDECFLCSSTNQTVTQIHGNLVLTVSSRAIPTACATTPGEENFVDFRAFATNLTLNPAIVQVMEAIGGKYHTKVISEVGNADSAVSGSLDVYICEIPYVACYVDGAPVPTRSRIAPEPNHSDTNQMMQQMEGAALNGATDAATPSNSAGDARGRSNGAEPLVRQSSKKMRCVSPALDQAKAQPLATTDDLAPASATNVIPPLTLPVDTNRTDDCPMNVVGTPVQRQLRVLIVDDSLMIQKMLRKWLEHANCIVSCAPNGKIGLNMMQSNEYDLVMMDFLMPVMLGLDCLKEFTEWKSSPEYDNSLNKDVLVIGMSATASEEEQNFGFENGMHFYTPKPVDLANLKIALSHKRKARCLDDCIEHIASVNCYTHRNSPREQGSGRSENN